MNDAGNIFPEKLRKGLKHCWFATLNMVDEKMAV